MRYSKRERHATRSMLFVAIVALVPGCDGQPSGLPASPRNDRIRGPGVDCDCLQDTNRPVIVWGDQNSSDDDLPLTDGLVIDARGQTFNIAERRDGIMLRADRRVDNISFVGGNFIGVFDPRTWSDWSAAKRVYGLRVEQLGDVEVCGVSVQNVGDGIKVRSSRGAYEVRHCYLKGCMDDAIECDDLRTFTVDDVLIESAHVCFAFREHKDARGTVDGGGKLISISNTLAALVPQQAVYKGKSPGHGGFIKYSTNQNGHRRPRIKLRNNIWMASQDANYNSLSLDPMGDVILSENNTLIWTGEGDFPEPLPTGWTLSRDRTLWDDAVANWKRRHGIVENGGQGLQGAVQRESQR